MTDEELARQLAEGRAREQECPHTSNPMGQNDCWECFIGGLGKTLTPEERDEIENGVVTFEQVAQEIYDECFDLLVQRQQRYGPTNIDQQGPWGVLSRIANDKLARIKRAFNGRVVHGEIVLDPITDSETDETYEDALKDLVNYGVILLLLHRGLWGKPLERDVLDVDAESYQ